MKEDGAEIVDDISLPDQQTIRPHEIKVMRTEFKVSLNAYLAGSTNQNGIHSLSDLINFNEQNAQNVMPYFQQEQLIAAEATNGLDDPDYVAALKECRRLTREEGIDKALLDHSCCALVAPTTSTPWAIDFLNGDNRIGGVRVWRLFLDTPVSQSRWGMCLVYQLVYLLLVGLGRITLLIWLMLLNKSQWYVVRPATLKGF